MNPTSSLVEEEEEGDPSLKKKKEVQSFYDKLLKKPSAGVTPSGTKDSKEDNVRNFY